MTDYASESVSRTRIPRDEFEAEVFRRVIQADTKRWYDTDALKISVGETPDESGAYDLHIREPSDDVMSASLGSKGEMRGKVWLAENEHPVTESYRVRVWHEVEGQEANYGFPPVPNWRVRGGR